MNSLFNFQFANVFSNGAPLSINLSVSLYVILLVTHTYLNTFIIRDILINISY